MSDETDTPEDEVVGYGKPPKDHQFKPGKSGNPKGRPKGPGNFLKLIAKHAAKKVTVIEGGTEKKMAKMDVVIAAMFNKASKGDVAAARLIANLITAASQIAGDEYQSGYSDADLEVILAEADWQVQLVKLRQEQIDEES
jgi:hypothetical protein